MKGEEQWYREWDWDGKIEKDPAFLLIDSIWKRIETHFITRIQNKK